MTYAVIALAALLVYQGLVGYYNKRDLIKMIKESHDMLGKTMDLRQSDYAEWCKERQQLLDRIQAPSFDHLKHQEAKIIKAQNEQPKEVVTLEVV